MRIEDVVDVEKFPYVCPFNWTIHTYLGDFEIIRGWLSDGASKVPDRDLEAFFAHDRLYVLPVVDGVRITQYECDRIYGDLLWKRHHYFHGWLRPRALKYLGYFIFQHYRRLEQEDPDFWKRTHVVPHVDSWHFPSFDTADAVWIGAAA